MTTAEKKEWLKNATDAELLHQYISLHDYNEYGALNEDIWMTEDKILDRMRR